MLRLLVDFWRWWLSRLGVHLKSNARPATPSRVERSDKMSDPFSKGTGDCRKRTNLRAGRFHQFT
jgi:hypothetical protein